MAMESFYQEDNMDSFIDLEEWVESHLDWDAEGARSENES